MYTLPKFNSSPLKSYQNPIGKELVFQQPFFGGYVKLRGGYIYIYIYYILFIIHLGYWYPNLGFIIFRWEKSLHEPICLVFAFTILNSWTSFLKTKQARKSIACTYTIHWSVFFGGIYLPFITMSLKKRMPPKKCVWSVFFCSCNCVEAIPFKKSIPRPSSGRMWICGFDLSWLKVSYIHEIYTFTWRCLQVFSLVGNTKISDGKCIYIYIYIIALFLIHIYHVLSRSMIYRYAS